MKEKYIGKVYNLIIVNIIVIMLVSIIITVLSSVSFSHESSSLISPIVATNDENYYSTSIDSGIVHAPNYMGVSNLDKRDVAALGADYVSSNIPKFSLADYIPLNTQIKNQGSTSTCWTFASAGSVQTNLALKDYLADKPAYNYDFSERHVALSSVETSSNNYGYNRDVIDGATYWMAMNYYTRAAGPVLENECEFSTDNTTVPNNSNTYNLNKAATVTDIRVFPAPGDTPGYTQKTQINQMKTFIRTKGSLCTSMYFPTYTSEDTFNTSTGASYVSNASEYTVNHMVSIVGWDDNYSKENFNSKNRPQNDGAWLIRNSHGKAPYTDDGFLHISYEDKLIYYSVFGIENVDLAKNYSKTVGYAEKGMNYYLYALGGTYSLCTVYDRNKNSSINEFIDSVSLYVTTDSTISVAIAEGDYNTNKNLTFTPQTITNSTSATPGFRTFNLKTPYKFNTTSSNSSGLSDKVTVKVTVATTIDKAIIPLEGGFSKSYVKNSINSDMASYKKIGEIAGTTKTESGRCFLVVDGYDIMDLGTDVHAASDELVDSDSTMQLNLVAPTQPTGSLAAKTNPTKTTYTAGENFNSSGLTLKYNAGHGSTLNIDLADCTLKKNKSLTAGQTAVEVYGYGTKLDVPITVNLPYVEMTPTLTIKTNPNKTSYYVGDNFNSKGLVLKYTHGNQNDPTVDEIPASSITITDGTNLKQSQTYVTAKYNNLTVRVPITVSARPVVEMTPTLTIKTNPNKTSYYVGDNFNSKGLVLTYTHGDQSNPTVDTIQASSITITDGTNLKQNQTYVTAKYNDLTVRVPITVSARPVIEMTPTLTIKTNPSKTSYYVGDNFNSKGLVLTYTHGDQSNPTVDTIQASSITITDGTNLKENQTYVTAKYNNLTVRVPITVTKKVAETQPEPEPQNQTQPETQTQTPTFNDTNNLNNISTELTEYRISTTNNIGFDSFKVSIKDINENSGAIYKYYYYVSNTKDGTGTRNEVTGNISDGSFVLNIDPAAAGSAFKLNAAGDAIYLTIIQVNKTANTEVSKTIQVEGNSNTKIYVNGQYVQDGTTIQGETEIEGEINTEIENNEVTTNTTITYTTNNNNSNSSSKTTPISSTGDTTVAKKKIPQTGTAEEILKIVIISIVLIGGAFVIKSYIVNRKINGK